MTIENENLTPKINKKTDQPLKCEHLNSFWKNIFLINLDNLMSFFAYLTLLVLFSPIILIIWKIFVLWTAILSISISILFTILAIYQLVKIIKNIKKVQKKCVNQTQCQKLQREITLIIKKFKERESKKWFILDERLFIIIGIGLIVGFLWFYSTSYNGFLVVAILTTIWIFCLFLFILYKKIIKKLKISKTKTKRNLKKTQIE